MKKLYDRACLNICINVIVFLLKTLPHLNKIKSLLKRKEINRITLIISVIIFSVKCFPFVNFYIILGEIPDFTVVFQDEIMSNLNEL